MAQHNKSQTTALSGETAGLSLLLSRVIEQVGWTHCKDEASLADWIQKLHANVMQDIDGMMISAPSAPPEAIKQVTDAAKGTVNFTLGRIGFNANA